MLNPLIDRQERNENCHGCTVGTAHALAEVRLAKAGSRRPKWQFGGGKRSLADAVATSYEAAMSEGMPLWDEAFGDRLLGAVILVGITRRTAEGDHQDQFFGTIEHADAKGIELRLGGSRSGESYFLPPDLNNIFPAQPGSYRLRQTGEVVENPDYTATWMIHPQGH